MRNTRFSPNPVLRFAAIALALAAFLGSGSAMATSDSNTSDVKAEVKEALEAMQHYAADQRDDALRSAQNALVRLDARIDRLELRAESTWDSMSEAMREKTNHALRALRKQREEVAEWYGAMKHSSVEAWDEVKDGFSSAYAALADAVDDARQAY